MNIKPFSQIIQDVKEKLNQNEDNQDKIINGDEFERWLRERNNKSTNNNNGDS